MAYFTKREIRQLSSPACSPRYTVTIPAGTECELITRKPRRSDYAVKDVSKVRGSNPHDLKYYFVWIDESEIEDRDSLRYWAEHAI